MQQQRQIPTNKRSRPLTDEDETQRRKKNSQPKMKSMTYHHGLSKIYLKAYNDTFLKVTVEELLDFIGFKEQSFLELLNMMTSGEFPCFQKNISQEKAFMNEPIPFSLYEGLLRLRQKEGFDKKNKGELPIRKQLLKQLHLITLLLNGMSEIDLKANIQQNESNQTFFRRKYIYLIFRVSWFLNRTTLLTPRVFYWHVMYWDWVMESVQQTLAEHDSQKQIKKQKGRKKKQSIQSSRQNNQANIVKSTEEKSNYSDSEEQSETKNLPQNFLYDQVEPNIHAAIEKHNYLNLRNKKPSKIDVEPNGEDSELKFVEHTIKQTYKMKLQEKIVKKRQQNRKIMSIRGSNSQKSEKKSKTVQKQEKKKSKAPKFINSHSDSQEKIIQKHPPTKKQYPTFELGVERRYELDMKNDEFINCLEFDDEQQIQSQINNHSNSSQSENSSPSQNISQHQRVRQYNHNINEMNPIITNLLIHREVIGQTIATEIYYALINSNVRIIKEEEKDEQMEKQSF